MDTSALRTFAPEARRQLLEAVERKLDFVLTGDTADLRAAHPQVDRLRQQAEAGRTQLLERIAYTWFNRLAALRFLDARGWHPFRTRILTAALPQETQPEVLRLVRTGVLPEELAAHTDPGRLNDLLDGRLPSFDPQAEVYRHLVLAACRFYHALLPFLFERLDDETELLLPDDLLTEHSVAQGFRTAIRDEDCAEVEVLGWLYQFYISEKKDQVMARKGAVASEDIPSVTQLFTPDWIVRYLVENSLGRLWLRSRPGSSLRAAMPYYVDDPEGQAPADSLTVSRPEEIRLLDPACGSGHMLTYAFDLLFQIYEEEGHAPAEIPARILTHNLYGLEICPRATQLAQFALLARARERSPRAFHVAVRPNVICLQNIAFASEEVGAWRDASWLSAAMGEKELKQLHQFREDMETFGSLIQPVLSCDELRGLREAIEQAPPPTDLLLAETQRKAQLVLDQAEMLSQRYHVVVTNPPYMGGRQMNETVKYFARDRFPDSKTDLFAMFIERSFELVGDGGLSALVTMQSWMFLGSFERLRERLLQTRVICAMAHMANMVMGIAFGTSATVWEKMRRTDYLGQFCFVSLDDLDENNRPTTFPVQNARLRRAAAEDFGRIPGTPIAYWTSEAFRQAFIEGEPLSRIAPVKIGMRTGDNAKYLRRWFEVGDERFEVKCASAQEAQRRGAKWLPYNKGGEFRKWYGNNEYVVNWEDDGRSIKEETLEKYPQLSWDSLGWKISNEAFFFQPCLTWTFVSSSRFGVRVSDGGFIFDVGGSCAFPDAGRLKAVGAFLCSPIAHHFLEALNPTLNFQVENVGRLPWMSSLDDSNVVRASVTCEEAVQRARTDWDNFETSWDFQGLPLLRDELRGTTLEASWLSWEAYLKGSIARMQELETENNRLWIQAYRLEDELTPEVPAEEITLARPDRRKDVAAFLSYAVGCMLGRYSLDAPGLILADPGATLEEYRDRVGKPLAELTFTPDEDGVIPVLGGEWFEDDIVARTRDFLRVTFGEATLEDNLRFIEDALGKDLRRYFVSDFFKDHLQTYKKRPIYWLFQSPKKGFQCLVYLHRYTHDTPNRVLNRYLREYTAKIGYRLEHLDHRLASESTPPHEKTRARKESDELRRVQRECEEWEREVLLPLAQQRLALDLDDGVKVNYLKLGKALAPIPGLAGRGEE